MKSSTFSSVFFCHLLCTQCSCSLPTTPSSSGIMRLAVSPNPSSLCSLCPHHCSQSAAPSTWRIGQSAASWRCEASGIGLPRPARLPTCPPPDPPSPVPTPPGPSSLRDRSPRETPSPAATSSRLGYQISSRGITALCSSH